MDAEPEIKRYLDALYGTADAGQVVVSWLVAGQLLSSWHDVNDLDTIAAKIAGLAPKYDTCVGVNLRKPGPAKGRGGAQDVLAVTGLYIDIDYFGGAHKQTNLPTRQDVLDLLATLPMQWSLILDTGGGFHNYLLFKEPWVLDDEGERGEAGQLLKDFQHTFRVIFAEKGWHLDSTADLARILRPGGTLNYKYQPPRPVTIHSLTNTRYNLSDIAEAPWLVPMAEPEHTHEPPKGPRPEAGRERTGTWLDRSVDFAWWRELLEAHGWTLAYSRGEVSYWRRPGKNEGGISATLGACKDGLGIPLFYNFSSGGEPFTEQTAYGPFAAFGLLAHGGDYRAARQALLPQQAVDTLGDIAALQSVDSLFAALPNLAHLTPGQWGDLKYFAKALLGDGLDLTALNKEYRRLKRPQAKISQTPAANTPLSDVYNAEQFAIQHGDDFRYCPSWKTWLTWTGSHWQPDESGEVMRRARTTVKAFLTGAADMEESELKAMMSHVKNSLKNTSLNGMLAQAQVTLPYPIGPEAFDQHPWLLNVCNGCIDLRTGELRPHQRQDYITHCLPVTFDPDAKCPTWNNFLHRIMGGGGPWDDDTGKSVKDIVAANEQARQLIGYLQRCVGYTLSGDTSEECFFLLHGIGRNGKSKVLETIAALLGSYAKQAEMSTFLAREKDGVRDDLADLRGSRFVSAVEIQEGRRMAEALIKQLTGGDRIKARFLFSKLFEYTPTFKVWLAVNHLPVIRGTDLAIWERIRRIPFRVTIPKPERDKRLLEKLLRELPGILNWAIEGCLTWQSKGLEEPEAITAAIGEYRAEMDIVKRFVDECCMTGQDYKTKAGYLFAAFTRWCQEIREAAVTQTAFGLRLKELGYEKATSNGTWYKGIGLPG